MALENCICAVKKKFRMNKKSNFTYIVTSFIYNMMLFNRTVMTESREKNVFQEKINFLLRADSKCADSILP